MIAIVDYGVGNLFSRRSSLAHIGAEAVVTGDPAVIAAADRVILPGVGAFGDAAQKLRKSGLGKVVCDEAERGKPLLGICLGMQLLFERSYEYGEHEGLGLLKGSVVPMAGRLPPELKIPQIGWNQVNGREEYYFVHSYYVEMNPFAEGVTEYAGVTFASCVRKDNILAAQFHPEKSGRVGLKFLSDFLAWNP